MYSHNFILKSTVSNLSRNLSAIQAILLEKPGLPLDPKYLKP